MIHRSTLDILTLLMEELKEHHETPLSLVNRIDKKGLLTKYERKKIREFIRNHPITLPPRSWCSDNIRYYDIIPNELWYKSHIYDLRQRSKDIPVF
ncbi:hypothetical protein Molly5_141 [Maribacter phage Molly_5]|uniref:Uncharacterized protein n=1 Tax=Maribacter phage Molly_1 TaxID=2745685 RepID=A0A8E4UY70_9CAUD|nr:hypothetical protein M1M29_gp140 [Maribacter phage Molly_1]QQO97634.1 hypothetical protein Molly2_140 [Maribacter phage Molly_2]QQO97834.1 hypothetical protein Molly3_140 [Maribacter phage Molly_3]QQO98035.1 hypothetical protein Molly4_141 [Maribacter phage Molly_4]QQO98235.1 hypothetical protein Molly5_141 [Maribacter phage Molly_5]QQO97434.1 hypothetical protein Molly1_140 [Maribacter phage Molly_1]